MKQKNTQKVKYLNGTMNQNCVVNNFSLLSEINYLMGQGDINGVMELLEVGIKNIGIYHPLYPDYTIGIKNFMGKNVPYSKPSSIDATVKFPQAIKGKFNIVSNSYGFKTMNELLDYSYRTQTDIEIDMIELKKMIGEMEDPYQHEMEIMTVSENVKWVIRPREFPPAKPYKILIEDTFRSFDYILLRATKVTEDNKIYLSNKEQEYYVQIELIFDLDRLSIDINLSLNNKMHFEKGEKINYLKFLNEAKNGMKVNIVSLEENTIMASGNLKGMNIESGFNSIESEIEFLENICVIEEKYNRKIDIPKEVLNDEIVAINYLSKGITEGRVVGKWEEYISEVELAEYNIEILKSLQSDSLNLMLKAELNINIFDEIFEVPITRLLKSAKIVQFEKLKRKLNVFEPGDILKLKMIPKDDDSFEDIFDFESNKENNELSGDKFFE